MAFFNFVDAFTQRVLGPAIDARMRQAMEAGLAASRELAPVDTGNLKSLIGGIYDQNTRTVTLYGDAKYTAFQELGYRTRSGRRVPGKHFLKAGLAAMGHTWGGTIEVQLPTLEPKYRARTISFAKGQIGKAKLHVFHRPPARA